MASTGRDKQLVKQIGEYLVASELGRLGFVATTFAGNVPIFDILAVNQQLMTWPIQVKTIRTGDWQLNAEDYIRIRHQEDGTQNLLGKKPLTGRSPVCVFIKIGVSGNDEFFVFPFETLQEIVYRKYKRSLEKRHGKRARNVRSTHVSVSRKDIALFAAANLQVLRTLLG